MEAENDLRSTERQLLKGGAITEILATVQSLKQARRALDELAVGWKAGDYGSWSVIYEKGKHRLYVEKKAERQWQIIKKTVEEVTV